MLIPPFVNRALIVAIAFVAAGSLAHAESRTETQAPSTNLGCTLAILASVKAYEVVCFPDAADQKSAAIDEAIRILGERAVSIGYVKSSELADQLRKLTDLAITYKERHPEYCAKVDPDHRRYRASPWFVYTDIRKRPPQEIRETARDLAAVPAEKLTGGCL